MMMTVRLVLLFLGVLCSGCSGAITVPHFNPKDASAQAMAEYDSNHDGYLDAQELKSCPGLGSALTRFDQNKDGRLSQTEIEEGLASLQDEHVGLKEVLCKVTLGGKPLADALIVVEPESILGSELKPARGTTNNRGFAHLQIDGSLRTGCNLGLYRVRITKTNDKGQEMIPARYNTQTELGLVVAAKDRGGYTFRLISP